MDARSEISDFLRSRRDRITPEQVGLSGGGGMRRVPGLRREEVAVLASISVDWYVRIERGHLSGVSDEVLHSLADALRLDEAERDHLLDLARGAQRSRRAAPTDARIRPGLQIVLDGMSDFPAWIRDQRMDLVALNPLARALFSPILESEIARGNNARYTFLDPTAKNFYLDWEDGADAVVGSLRSYVGANPTDRRLSNLIGELATRSPAFATRWAAHNVRHHRAGTKRMHHPVVGDLDLQYEGLGLPDDPRLSLFVYYPVPGTDSQERLALLASWAATTATPDIHADPARVDEETR